jgi:hypothetical protein
MTDPSRSMLLEESDRTPRHESPRRVTFDSLARFARIRGIIR